MFFSKKKPSSLRATFYRHAISNRLLFFLENEVSRPLLTHSMNTLSRSSMYNTVAMLPTKRAAEMRTAYRTGFRDV